MRLVTMFQIFLSLASFSLLVLQLLSIQQPYVELSDRLEYPEIDIVYTWVNGSDPIWNARKIYFQNLSIPDLDANSDNRYRDHDELRYSLRSIEKFAPWVRHIHLVVADGQKPYWLKLNHPRLHLVNHSTIFASQSDLPTFSGVAVESNLDRIPNLSDYFLYFNDDVFLGQKIFPSDFLISKFTGEQKMYFERWTVKRGQCRENCTLGMLQNDQCNSECNITACGFDNGKCGVPRDQPIQHERISEKKGDFIASIDYTNTVFFRKLGPAKTPRHVVCHVPHLINKRMMKDMKQRFKTEFQWTSSHRFRHHQDMQFAFSYFHYINQVGVYAPTKDQLWKQAIETVDASTFLYDHELWTMESEEYQRALVVQKSPSFRYLQQCATQISRNQPINKEKCDQAVENLMETVRLPVFIRLAGRFQDITFNMLGDDVDRSVKMLRRVAQRPSKFITLNDDQTKPHTAIDREYHHMLHQLFPIPSAFES